MYVDFIRGYIINSGVASYLSSALVHRESIAKRYHIIMNFVRDSTETVKDLGYMKSQHLHQYTATKSFSLRSRSSCLAVTSSITGSASFCLPAEPRDEADSSAFVFAAAST